MTEYKSKVKLVQSYLEKAGLSAFLVTTKINRQYVSGFTGSVGVVLITKSSAWLFVDDRYTLRARRESPLPVKNLKALPVYLVRFKKIGIEDQISLRELKRLKKIGKGFIATSNVVENLRSVKTAQEITYLKKAQKLVDATFWHLKKFTKAGLTEAEIALELERYAKKLGADGLAFDSIIASGPNAAAPHHLSGSQKIRNGNFLLLDFGVLNKGYHSDFTRTLFIGNPNQKQERVYNTVLEAQRQGIAKVQVGNLAKAVDAAARGYIQKQGFGKYFTHNTGHGVGLEIHELPKFSPDAEDMLKSKMVVTVEPGIYIENWGGVRIEDMVEVAPRGPKLFSKVPRDLQSMIIKK